MYGILWVHKDLVFVCGLVVLQVPLHKVLFFSQKEHLIDNEKNYSWVQTYQKKKDEPVLEHS